MKTLSSREVQKSFGAVADQVKAGEVIRITHHGRRSMLMLPDTEETEAALRQLAGARLIRMLKAAPPNAAAQALTQEKINQMIADGFA